MKLYAFTCGWVTGPFRGEETGDIRIPVPCYLVDHPAGKALIDTGLHPEMRHDPHARIGWIADVLGFELPEGEDVASRLRSLDTDPAKLRYLVNTHLHFDHAGGNTFVEQASDPPTLRASDLQLSFPNARYYVQSGDLEFARHANERTRASYLPHNWEPVAQAGKFKLLEGDGEVLSGISVRLVPGHVPFLQGVLLQSGPDALFYLADLMPTRHHLPLPWIMGYDVEPLRTLESKRRLIRDALAGGWWLFFEHDPEMVMGRLSGDEKRAELKDLVAAPGRKVA
jgi:glyoxylase-like metal-dependent hydrolase (beta-lactamase superfamily II)